MYRSTELELNSIGPYTSSEREIQFRRGLFTFSTKREIRDFHVVVVQKRHRDVQKSEMHVQSCLLIKPIVFVFKRSRCLPVV